MKFHLEEKVVYQRLKPGGGIGVMSKLQSQVLKASLPNKQPEAWKVYSYMISEDIHSALFYFLN